jgi:predicted transcriptional regulator
MARQSPHNLSRRERQIMDIIYQRGQASAAEVLEDLPDPPSYSAIRALLRILEEKGHLKHKKVGKAYVYLPTLPRDRARRSALQRLVQTFFDGSTQQVVATLLDLNAPKLSDQDLDQLAALIERVREEERE